MKSRLLSITNSKDWIFIIVISNVSSLDPFCNLPETHIASVILVLDPQVYITLMCIAKINIAKLSQKSKLKLQLLAEMVIIS